MCSETSRANQVSSWEAHHNHFQIRRAERADVAAIVALVNDAYSEQDHGYYRLNNGKGEGSRTSSEDVAKRVEQGHKIAIFVCVKKGDQTSLDQIVGTIYLKHHRKKSTDKGDVCMFAINGDYRGKYQIGSRLMQAVEQEARRHQLRALSLDVVAPIGEHNQDPLIHYYVNNGYALTGDKSTLMYHTFKQETTLLKMEKELP